MESRGSRSAENVSDFQHPHALFSHFLEGNARSLGVIVTKGRGKAAADFFGDLPRRLFGGFGYSSTLPGAERDAAEGPGPPALSEGTGTGTGTGTGRRGVAPAFCAALLVQRDFSVVFKCQSSPVSTSRLSRGLWSPGGPCSGSQGAVLPGAADSRIPQPRSPGWSRRGPGPGMVLMGQKWGRRFARTLKFRSSYSGPGIVC